MNSILLTSNISKFSGTKFAPKSFKYQPQVIEKKLNKVIGDKFTPEFSYRNIDVEPSKLKRMLQAPNVVFVKSLLKF